MPICRSNRRGGNHDYFISESIKQGYGTDVILTDVSFHVNAGDRVGIVGRNGAGKTTLLKLLTGELTADEGNFSCQDTRVGYLKQRDNFDSEGTVIGEIDKIFSEIHDLEAQIEQVSAEIEAGGGSAAQMEKARPPASGLRAKGGRLPYKSQRLPVFCIPWLSPRVYNKKIGALSGGERTRLALAALRSKNRIFCFSTSRPTIWTSVRLSGWSNIWPATKGTIMVVSHDRYFLDRIATAFLVENHKVYTYEETHQVTFSKRRCAAEHSSVPTTISAGDRQTGRDDPQDETAWHRASGQTRGLQRKASRYARTR